MPRPRTDHAARRREVSAAVWRVLATRGFGGLTMRTVATESGATTGMLTHYFRDKRDLTDHALDLLDLRVAERQAAAPRESVRDAVLALLPATPERVEETRVWIGSWDVALGDPDVAAGHAERYARSRERLAVLVRQEQARGELAPGSPAAIAARVQAFALGLAVQAVLDPDAFPPRRQRRLMDEFLTGLAPR